MNSKEYVMPDGKKAVFEYDHDGIGKVTIDAMDMLMGLIADGRKRGAWITHDDEWGIDEECSVCKVHTLFKFDYCPHCGAKMGEREGE